MSLPDDSNIVFLDSGVDAVIKQTGHPDKPVVVLFDLYGGVEMGIMSEKPQITIMDSDLSGIDLKAVTITVTGKYPPAKIVKPLPDGSGVTVAHLQKA